MTYSFKQLFDKQKVKELTEIFFELTGIANALIDAKGKTTICTGWKQPKAIYKLIQQQISNRYEKKHIVFLRCTENVYFVKAAVFVNGHFVADYMIGKCKIQNIDSKNVKTIPVSGECKNIRETEKIEENNLPEISKERIEKMLCFIISMFEHLGSIGISRKKLQQTEIKLHRKEAELQKTHTKLNTVQNQLVVAEKMAALGQLTAGIAHEINNPINFIAGNINPLQTNILDIFEILTQYDIIVRKKNLQHDFSEIEFLKRDMEYQFLVDEISDLLAGIVEGARRTKEIVAGLRHFSRRDNKLKRVNIIQGIESTLVLLRNKTKHGIQIQKEYGDIPQIECIPGKINQLFMNILANAVQAIEGKGKITIKTAFDNKNVIISIKDTGKGMDDATKKRIFEPFFTTKDADTGTGLGLSISLDIIKLHKGSINVKSKPGNGSEFIISLPVSQSA